MLLNLYKQKWNSGLQTRTCKEVAASNAADLSDLARLSKDFTNWIKTENTKTTKEFKINSVGKIDPARHILEKVNDIQNRSLLHNVGLMVNTKVF